MDGEAEVLLSDKYQYDAKESSQAGIRYLGWSAMSPSTVYQLFTVWRR